ncbi:MAG: hypothetical protein IPK60_05325 [Sandaracinaceae bacterium]|nr:hypothetical protein [Sandaracinaceae bacterium]
MNKQQILFGVLGATLLGVTGYLAFRPHASLPEKPLESVPNSAVLVAHANVAALIRSPVFRELTQGSGDSSIARLRSLCGFNPLEAIREATLFVSEGGNLSPEHIGVVLRGRVGAGDLGQCLRRAVETDGGTIRNTTIEGFPAVVSTGGVSRAVFVGDDGFVEGAEAPVLAALHAANGSGRSAARDPQLADLWEKLGADRDLSVLSRVPASWREPLTALAARQQIPALAHLVAMGIGLRVAEGVTAAAIIRASAPEFARSIAEAITAYKAQIARTALIGFTPFGAALAGVRIEAQGNDVVIAADLTAAQVSALVSLVTEGGLSGIGGSAPQAPPGVAQQPTPAPTQLPTGPAQPAGAAPSPEVMRPSAPPQP